MDILDQAILFEYEGHKFYSEQAAKAKNAGVRGILENLAKDELDHAAFLESLKAGARREFPPSPTMSNIRKIIETHSVKKESFLAEDADLLETLKTALEFEDRARKHFEDEALTSVDGETATLLKLLAREEEKHFHLINNLIRFIDNPGSLLETQEFQRYHD